MKRSPLVVIFITIFIDLVGFGIVIPILPFYVTSERFAASPRVVGLLLGIYSLMQFVFSPILGRLSDRYGRRIVLLLSITGTGIGFLIMGVAPTLAWLFVGRILDGITGGNISTAQAYIADVTKPEERARGMGLIGAAFGMGFVFGPALGGVLSRWGLSAPLYFAAALAFANAVLLYFVLPESLPAEARRRADERHRARGWRLLREEFAKRRLAVVTGIYFLIIVAFSIMTSSFALFALYRFALDAQHIGYVFSFIGIVAVAVQLLVIRRSVRRFGEVPFVVTGLGGVLAGLILLPLIGPSTGGIAALLATSALISIGNQLATPLLTSLASKAVGEDVQGGVLGAVQSVGSLARFIGPALGAALIASRLNPNRVDDYSLALTFWTAAGVAALACLLSLLLLTREKDTTRRVVEAAAAD